MIHSVRFKLTLLYALTVMVLLAVFIGGDVISLKRNLVQQATDHAISLDTLEGAWLRAIWEHILLGSALVLFAFAFGYVFIRRALRPVREMARTAKSISEKNLSLRVNAAGDRAEIGELADTLNSMIARLESSFDRIKHFSADAAHELITPLTVVRGEIEITLRRERRTTEYQETLTKVRGQVDNLFAIVESLLFLAHSDERRVGEINSVVSLDNLTMMAFESFHVLAHQRGISMRLGHIHEVSIRGDAQLLRRMLDNLIGNALKFTLPGGHAFLELIAGDGWYRLTIADSGIGIPQEDLPHVFDRFYRVEKSRSKNKGGAGLGLAIVREIADVHGIEIRLESQLNTGTKAILAGRL